MEPIWLLLLSTACALLSLSLCWIARSLFPHFRSGELSTDLHSSNVSEPPVSGREIKTIELPLVGGPALTLAIIAGGITSGFLFNFTLDQWHLMLIGLGALTGYMLVGLVDDWKKVHSGQGITQRAKFVGVFVVSLAAVVTYYLLVARARQPYAPYSDILGSLFNEFPFTWLILLVVVTGGIGSVSSLSVDFSDGMDGLAGGLILSAALAFGIIASLITQSASNPRPERIVLEVLSLLTAAATLGFLRWNWPSSWAARHEGAVRHASIYMGGSGALALGGLLAIIAIFARQEVLLLMIGCVFVLEGLSAVFSHTLTRFFRKNLKELRFSNAREPIPQTEYPRPFLATPLHHHFDLLGWDRRRIVYGGWALGACFATLGILIFIFPETWQRYLVRIIVIILAWLVWSSGGWMRRYFVGKHPAERNRPSRLALFYGYPYRILGIRLYYRVETTEVSEDVIETPAEELGLWQRMNIFDARAMLGLYCYRAGYYHEAQNQWTRIPDENRALRPDIAHLLDEVHSRLAMENQETQPMRRDQMKKQSPILTGNLGPADRPNPHTPVDNNESPEDPWLSPFSSEAESTPPPVESEPSPQSPFPPGQVPFEPIPTPDTPPSAVPTAEDHQSWLSRIRRSTPT